MDNTTNTNNTGGNWNTTGPAGDPREELRAQLQTMGKAAGELLEQLVKVPSTLAQIPLQALPEDTATHARNAATEGFAAVRTLLDGVSHGLDELMKAQRERVSKSGGSASSSMHSDSTRSLDDSGAHDTGSGNGSTVRLDDEP